jgi:hypothetical protein
VASRALLGWRGQRATRLNELVLAHRRVTDAAAGRPTETTQINWALMLHLAAEFQGFARDLHTEGVDTFAARAAAGNPVFELTLTALLTRSLELDKRNAQPESLKEAFDRFGLVWWDALVSRDARTGDRRQVLVRVNRARNAVAHSDHAAMLKLRGEGFPLTLATFRKSRSSLSALALTMDVALSIHLSTMFGGPRPW